MKAVHESISRRTGTVGFFTLLSRVMGLIRDVVVAFAFGATGIADAFYVAFRIPNLFRRLVGEGALTVSFIPIFTEYLKRSRAEGRRAASITFTFLACLLSLLAIVGVLFAPWLVRLVAFGFEADPEKFSLTVLLTRIMFPYIVLISFVALAMGVLNTCKRFAAPAASPILLNLAIIFGALVLHHFFSVPVVGLAVGVMLGGVLQLFLQVPALRQEGLLPRLDFHWRHPALMRLGAMMLPAAYGAAVYQLNVLVNTFLASFLPEGSISYLWYADRVAEFPLGVFAVSVAVATLPSLADHAAEKDMLTFKETMNYSLRLTFLIALPAAAGLYVLAEPIVRMLFARGAFVESTVIATAGALKFFAIQIPCVAAIRNLVPGFYALKDSKTPALVATVSLVVNLVVALFLMGPMLHVGLALSMAIASFVNMVLLLYLFRRKVGPIGGRRMSVSLFKTLAATGIMVGGVLALRFSFGFFETGQKWIDAGQVLLLMALAAIVFVLIMRVLSPDEYLALLRVVRRKRGSSGQVEERPPCSDHIDITEE